MHTIWGNSPMRTIRNALTMVAAAAAITGLVGVPASAATAGQDRTLAAAAVEEPTTPNGPHAAAVGTLCPSGWFCVWPQPNFHGSWKGGNHRNTCYSPFRPVGHSVSNQTGRTIRVYSRINCTGSYFDLPTHHYSNPTPFAVQSVVTR